MINLKRSILTDDQGKPIGVLFNMVEYRRLLAELEELESLRAYDAAKASGDKAIPFERAVAVIERKRK